MEKEKHITYLNLFLFTIILLVVSAVIYVIYRASESSRDLFTLKLIPLIAGLFFEGYRITRSKKNVLLVLAGSFLFSLFYIYTSSDGEGFIDHFREFDIEENINFAPYMFMGISSLGFMYMLQTNKNRPKITEGITLLQTLSLIYFIIDRTQRNNLSDFGIIILCHAFLPSVFTLINALSSIRLSRKIMLWLSAWSCLIMFVFALVMFWEAAMIPEIEHTNNLSDGIVTSIQFFLVGVACIYACDSILMVISMKSLIAPEKEQDRVLYKQMLIERFSEEQVPVIISIICIAYAFLMFSLNFKFDLIPATMMIWVVFFTFPYLLLFITKSISPPSSKK